jgi:hypothetical protein
MKITISGLKCDNPYCNYRDDSVQYSDYEKSIGRPCPQCGESLLTKEDFEKTNRLLKRIEIADKIINVTRWLTPWHYWNLVFSNTAKEESASIKF